MDAGARLGRVVYALRVNAMMSVEVTAHGAQLNRETLERIEAGQIEGIRLSHLVGLSASLGVDVKELLKRARW